MANSSSINYCWYPRSPASVERVNYIYFLLDILIIFQLASTCVDRVAHLLRCLSLADHVLAYWWNADASNIQRLHLISFAASTCWKPLPGLASQKKWEKKTSSTSSWCVFQTYCDKIICITWQHLIWWHHCPVVFYSIHIIFTLSWNTILFMKL